MKCAFLSWEAVSNLLREDLRTRLWRPVVLVGTRVWVGSRSLLLKDFVYSGAGDVCEEASLPPPLQTLTTVPSEILESDMDAHNGKRSISTILRKNRGL